MRLGWYPLTPAGLSRRFRHYTGWEIHNCGHPTANYPWYAIQPQTGLPVFTHNMYAWREVETAMKAVEDLVANKAQLVKNSIVYPP